MQAEKPHPEIQPGEPASTAVSRLLEQYGGQLYSLALRLCRRREDAEDLVQEVFLQAFRKWDQFQGRSHPRTWLYTIAARACRRMHRRRAGQPRRFTPLHEVAAFHEGRVARVPEGGADALSERVQRESLEAVQEAIAGLPMNYRLPLILKEVVDIPVADVGAILGLKEGTIKARLHRARLRLRRAVVERLPGRPGAAPAYPLQVCLDLLAAKQEALDRGVPFPVQQQVVCERCRTVLASLDLTHELCERLGEGRLPAKLRQRLTQHLAGG
jgi:RNA polymerase sigma-70 factor (ECF subfamily)